MAKDEIKQIMINGHLVGIMGLSDIIKKAAKNQQGKNDEDIKNILLSEIILNNYVPPPAMDAYRQALLREFKIAQGLPVDDEPSQGLNITVLGIGCARCSQLENDVRDLLSEMKIAANLHHITDLKEIAQYGILGSPALAINNKVLSVGEVPPKSKIRQWIIEAYNPTDK
jgi:small redox-active disulfide protein 2